MTTREWIDATLPTTTHGPVQGEPVIVLDETHTALVDVFVELFGQQIENALVQSASVYDALSAVGNPYYQPYFDQWKTDGLIS